MNAKTKSYLLACGRIAQVMILPIYMVSLLLLIVKETAEQEYDNIKEREKLLSEKENE